MAFGGRGYDSVCLICKASAFDLNNVIVPSITSRALIKFCLIVLPVHNSIIHSYQAKRVALKLWGLSPAEYLHTSKVECVFTYPL